MSIKEDLLRGHREGHLLEAVFAGVLADSGERSTVAMELVTLHNDGLLDVVEAFESLENNPSASVDFFLTRHVFEEALPDLVASVPSVMRCALGLYREAGQDLAAGSILASLDRFLGKDPSRPRPALAEIESSPDDFADLLPCVLVAGSRTDIEFFTAQAIRLSQENNIELRGRAVFSLGRLAWPDGAVVPDDVIAALERSASAETDDQLLSGVVRSGVALVRHDGAQEPRVVEAVSTALLKGCDCTLHAAAEVLAFAESDIPASLRNVLLTNLSRVRPASTRTLDSLDFGISKLLGGSDPDPAIRLLEDLLLASPTELTMEAFDSTARELMKNKALMSKIMTRWFLTGERALCDGVREIASASHDERVLLQIDLAEIEPADPVRVLFVARKAVGYLFFQPVSAAMVLTSLMRATKEDEVRSQLVQLLFDPLLLSFTGKVREFVLQQSQLECAEVRSALEQALKSIDNYLDDLSSVGNLPALHPSEAHREAHGRHMTRLMAESWKAAEAQSVLLSLVSKSVLLYGRKSISYVYESDGHSHRRETPLHKHSTEMEFPRMLYLDPVGLDYMLRVFRNEKMNT